MTIVAQHGIIAFQGAPGAYSDLACRTVYPDWQTLPCLTFAQAFAAVRDKRSQLAMIPVDNSLAGRVADVHHLLPQGGLYIIGEHFQPIRHCLLGIKGAKISDLHHVHSHIHALPQCQRVIQQLGLTSHVHADTAGAAADIAKMGDKSHGAIASSLAADIDDLEILQEDIHDESHNTTRFLILAPQAQIPAYTSTHATMISLHFTVRNIPAALYKSLGGFATNGLSLAKLESYVDQNFQAARFYAEVEAHPESTAFQNALEELRFFAQDIQILGAYQAHGARKP